MQAVIITGATDVKKARKALGHPYQPSSYILR